MELTAKTVQILARLDAVEQMISRVASENLPMESALRVHLQAHDVAEQLLIRCGLQFEHSVEDDFDVRHETDELLKMAVVPKTRSTETRKTDRTIHAKSQEPIDVGPEGAADPALRLPTDDSEELRTDPSEESSGVNLEALVAFEEEPQNRQQKSSDDALVSFDEIDDIDDDAEEDELNPIPLSSPVDDGKQYVFDDSPDEPLSTQEVELVPIEDEAETADDDFREEEETLVIRAADIDSLMSDGELIDETEPEPEPEPEPDLLPALSVEDEASESEPDLFPALSVEDEASEPDTDAMGDTAPMYDEPQKPQGASVRLKTIKVSKRTAANRTTASVRVSAAPEENKEEEVLAMSDTHEPVHHEVIATFEDDGEDEANEALTEAQARVIECMENAVNALKAGALEEAVDFYSDAIDTNGEHYEAYLGRGRVQLDLGDYGRAMSDFTLADELQPDNPNTRVALGDLFFARKEYTRAIEFYNAALQKLPEHPMAICRRGISFYYKRNFADALRDLEAAYKLDKSIPNIATYVVMAKKKVKNQN